MIVSAILLLVEQLACTVLVGAQCLARHWRCSSDTSTHLACIATLDLTFRQACSTLANHTQDMHQTSELQWQLQATLQEHLSSMLAARLLYSPHRRE